MKELFTQVAENATYVLGFVLVIVLLFAAALLLERAAWKRNNRRESVFTTKRMAVIGMFSATATILMLFEIPLFFAPGFYKLDFSELPILVGAFAFGPTAGVTMEFLKILLELCFRGTTTAFVGELANFAVGCSLILPASALYSFHKTKRNALLACIVGTLVLTVFGTAFNAVYLLPAFAKLFGCPLESLIAQGVEANSLVKEGNVVSFVIACVAPLNLIKGVSVSLLTMLIYKPLSPIIKEGCV